MMMADIVPTETVFGRGRLEKLHGKLKSNDIQTGHARWAELKKRTPPPTANTQPAHFVTWLHYFPAAHDLLLRCTAAATQVTFNASGH